MLWTVSVRHLILRATWSIPDRIVAAGVRHARGVSIFRHIAVDVFDEQIRSEHPMHEVPPDVQVIEVVLE